MCVCALLSRGGVRRGVVVRGGVLQSRGPELLSVPKYLRTVLSLVSPLSPLSPRVLVPRLGTVYSWFRWLVPGASRVCPLRLLGKPNKTNRVLEECELISQVACLGCRGWPWFPVVWRALNAKGYYEAYCRMVLSNHTFDIWQDLSNVHGSFLDTTTFV